VPGIFIKGIYKYEYVFWRLKQFSFQNFANFILRIRSLSTKLWMQCLSLALIFIRESFIHVTYGEHTKIDRPTRTDRTPVRACCAGYAT
jgi:hypothetical protein